MAGLLLLYDTLSLIFFFFFSSRRRHTRFDCDWSSDVCSSDLARTQGLARIGARGTDVSARSVKTDPRIEVRIEQVDDEVDRDERHGQQHHGGDRKSVVLGKECRSRWSPYH